MCGAQWYQTWHICIYLAHILSTPCTHLKHTLHTTCAHIAHILSTLIEHTLHRSCTHLVHILRTSCTHLAYILCTPCTHLAHILCTSCTSWKYTNTMYLKDQTCALFLKSMGFKDFKYDVPLYQMWNTQICKYIFTLHLHITLTHGN